MHVVKTVGTILPEVMDQKVALIFSGIWIIVFVDGEGVAPYG